MKVKCKQTTAAGFNLKEVTTIFSNDFDYSYGGSGLELNREYIVMGVVTYVMNNTLYYLVDANRKPDWFPYLLFDITDHSVPPDWSIRVNGKTEVSDIFSIIGFDELCNDEGFYDRLTDREEEAMRIYFRCKKELEKIMTE